MGEKSRKNIFMEERLTKDERKKLRQEEWKKELDADQKKKFRSRIFTWGIGAVVLAFAVWFVVTVMGQSSSSSSTNTDIKLPPITSNDIQDGPKNAPLQLVEYADFECPTCKLFYPIVKQLQADFQGKLLFVYRYFPLSTIHPNAENAAEAAQAANMQGKFWPMHDKLFDTQDDWASLPSDQARATFVTYAQQMGLNMDQFKKDFDEESTAKFVKDSEQNALDIGLNGTPTFFLNGKEIGLPGSYDAFKKLLQNQLQSK